MRFPEWLFRLLPGDQGSQQLGIIWRENSASANAATVGVTIYTVPTDKCLVLTNGTIRGSGSGAHQVSRRRLMADPPDGTVRYNILDLQGANFGAGINVAENWQGEVIIPGGWKVRAEHLFVAALAGNATEGEIHGYLIPRGTFVFG